MSDHVATVIQKFSRLSPARQAAIAAITSWNLWLSVSAELDLVRRPRAQVRGSRPLWALACLTNSVGPLAYFRWGRQDDGNSVWKGG